MNTAGSSRDAKAVGGYGNVEFNGLPASSNGNFLVGYDTNDPWAWAELSGDSSPRMIAFHGRIEF